VYKLPLSALLGVQHMCAQWEHLQGASTLLVIRQQTGEGSKDIDPLCCCIHQPKNNLVAVQRMSTQHSTAHPVRTMHAQRSASLPSLPPLLLEALCMPDRLLGCRDRAAPPLWHARGQNRGRHQRLHAHGIADGSRQRPQLCDARQGLAWT
jgi:hypothetical protein